MFRLVLILVIAAWLPLASLVAAERQESGVSTGVHSQEGVGGRPNTARITDGRNFKDITEQEYRERGYIPAFEKLPMRFVRRLPVRIPVPSEQDE